MPRSSLGASQTSELYFCQTNRPCTRSVLKLSCRGCTADNVLEQTSTPRLFARALSRCVADSSFASIALITTVAYFPCHIPNSMIACRYGYMLSIFAMHVLAVSRRLVSLASLLPRICQRRRAVALHTSCQAFGSGIVALVLAALVCRQTAVPQFAEVVPTKVLFHHLLNVLPMYSYILYLCCYRASSSECSVWSLENRQLGRIACCAIVVIQLFPLVGSCRMGDFSLFWCTWLQYRGVYVHVDICQHISTLIFLD